MEKLKEGNLNAASELFQRAVSITPSMAYQLIQILRSEDIEFVVAPYEADAQLAYLSTLEAENGGIIAVISEDSDLLAYGCPAIVFKMDRYGNGEEIVLHKVFESATCVPSFRHFDKELFIGMCVLAGCDFLPSVPGIGIAKAYSLVSKYRDLDRALSMLKFEKARQMPDDYPESFRKAVAVFQHARIYDADSGCLKHMKPLPEKLLQSPDGDLDFLGPEIPPSIAVAIAKGNLDPTTMEAFDQVPSSRPLMGRKAMIEENYLNEATKLEKLVCPLKTPSTEENKAISDNMSLKVPQNNPFRKRKFAEVQLDELEIVGGGNNFNEATELEKLVCSSKTVSTKENKEISDKIPLKVPENNPFRKRKSAEVQLDIVGEENNYFNEATELEKLVSPLKTPSTEENKAISDKTQLKVPENNLFRKGKFAKVQFDELKIVGEENNSNEATEMEKLVCPSKNPSTEENKTISDKIPLKVHENNPFRKRKIAEVQLDELEIVGEQVSTVTELERSETSCVTPESQQSVDSKPKRTSDGKRKPKNEKLKRSNCQSLEGKKCSILNFFSRV
ncbi:hypothetical protein Vadar_000902 [Vaccinium darrowii]|uniref:Uncharacterized protein n=1 Tax=Vaccinium darrowii TaxID=229202 RepID=A0ACB7YS41_9ERIC|nr:hypothetical protein Vadar_000902 [Vaccinium darrowii]